MKPSLTDYIERRLGTGAGTQARNFLVKPFGAGSFAEFWRYWNPVYGYFLYYYSYKPLRRFLPRPVAVFLTFLACGFLLHDLVGWIASRRVHYPEMTLIFALLGIGVILGEALRMDLSHFPFAIRAMANAAYIAAAVALVTILPP